MKNVLIFGLCVLTALGCLPRREVVEIDPPFAIERVVSPVIYNGETNPFNLDLANYNSGKSTFTLRLLSVDASAGQSYTVTGSLVTGTNRVHFELGRTWPILPGRYRLILTKADGQTTTTNDLLEVKAGRPQLDRFTVRVSPSIMGQPVTLKGQNLFSGGSYRLKLKKIDGTSVLLPITNSVVGGTQITAASATKLAPGYYSLALVDDNSLHETCYRFSVVQSVRHPHIMGVGDYVGNVVTTADFCPESGELPISRTTFKVPFGHMITFGLGQATRPDQFMATAKFIGVADGRVYRSPIQNFDLPWSGPNYVHAYYRFNADMPAGQYRLSVEITEKDTGEMFESEPFEKTIVLQ